VRTDSAAAAKKNQGHALALAAGQREALLADPCVEAPWQVVDEAGLGDVHGSLELLVRGAGGAEQQVLPHAGREQEGVVERDTDVAAQRGQPQVAHVVAVEGDRALGDVVQPGHELQQRRLSRPGAPHQGHGLAGPHFQVDAAQCPPVAARVSEPHVEQAQQARRRLERHGIGAVGDGRLGVENLEHPARPAGGLLGVGQDAPERLDGPHQHEDERDEGDQAAEGERSVAHGQPADEQNGAQGHVGHEVDERPVAALEPRRLQCRRPQPAGAVGELRLHHGLAAERLHDPDAGGRLLHQRGEVALVVLDLAGHAPVAASEARGDNGQRQERGTHEGGEGQVQAGQQADDHDERHRVDHHHHQAEADEPPYDVEVGHGPGQQLPRLPLVVERGWQALEVGVEVVPKGLLETRGRAGLQPAPEEGGERLEKAERQHQAGQRQDGGAPAVSDGAVHHPADDVRHRDGSAHPEDGRAPHGPQLPAVGTQVRSDAPERGGSHAVKRPYRRGASRRNGFRRVRRGWQHARVSQGPALGGGGLPGPGAS